jgi:hypothetical protein
MFLTRAELTELTDSPRKGRQIQWLMAHGVRFTKSLADRPKVLHAEIERVMMGGNRTEKNKPDFTRING